MITDATALDLAKEIAAFLKEKHGATKVLLFGSRAKGTATSGSDIDIYFESRRRDAELIRTGQATPQEIQEKNSFFTGSIEILDYSPLFTALDTA